MAYYNVCPHCGCSLDPDEKCDCLEQKLEQKKQQEMLFKRIVKADREGQMTFSFDGALGHI